MPTGLVAARQSFISAIGKDYYDVKEGDLFEVDHPLVVRSPAMFGPVKLRYPQPTRVEQATAAPGEKRGR